MEEIKDKLHEMINQLEMNNLEKTTTKINQYLTFLAVSKELWGRIPPLPTIEASESIIAPVVEDNINLLTGEAFPLERKLTGGFLDIPNGDSIFVPEKVIRLQNFVHGDYLTFTRISETNIKFEKVKESQIWEQSKRREIDFCIAKKRENGSWYSDERIYMGERVPIKINDATMTFNFTDEIAMKLHINELDLIVIAYDVNNINDYRIVWRYPEHQKISSLSPSCTPAKHEKKLKKSKNYWANDNERELVKGNTIIVVGGEFRKKDFDELTKEGEFTMIFLSGKESKSRIKAAARNASLIISAGNHSSHRGSSIAKLMSKKYHLPFRASPTSLSSIKRAIIHGLSCPEIQFYSLFNNV